MMNAMSVMEDAYVASSASTTPTLYSDAAWLYARYAASVSPSTVANHAACSVTFGLWRRDGSLSSCSSATVGSETCCSPARLVYTSRKYDHVTPLLHDLYWLWISDRIIFRLTVLAYRCSQGLAPPYLADDLHRVADVGSRLQSASTTALVVSNTVHSTTRTAHFLLQILECGTGFNSG